MYICTCMQCTFFCHKLPHLLTPCPQAWLRCSSWCRGDSPVVPTLTTSTKCTKLYYLLNWLASIHGCFVRLYSVQSVWDMRISGLECHVFSSEQERCACTFYNGRENKVYRGGLCWGVVLYTSCLYGICMVFIIIALQGWPLRGVSTVVCIINVQWTCSIIIVTCSTCN